MATGLRFYGEENVGCTAPLVLVIPPRHPPRFSCQADTHMQRDGFSSQHTTGSVGIARVSYVYSTSSILAMYS